MDKKHTRSLSGGIDSTDGHSGEELTIASPAEFVQQFGGKRVIEKVQTPTLHDRGWVENHPEPYHISIIEY